MTGDMDAKDARRRTAIALAHVNSVWRRPMKASINCRRSQDLLAAATSLSAHRAARRGAVPRAVRGTGRKSAFEKLEQASAIKAERSLLAKPANFSC